VPNGGRVLAPWGLVAASPLYKTLFSTNARNYCVFVVILYSNRTGRPPLFSTVGPRKPETTTPTTLPIFPLGGSGPPAFQFLAENIPSSSTQPMFQSAFDTTTEDQLGWDQMGLGGILATLDAPQ
jgi:hypothetical protein